MLWIIIEMGKCVVIAANFIYSPQPYIVDTFFFVWVIQWHGKFRFLRIKIVLKSPYIYSKVKNINIKTISRLFNFRKVEFASRQFCDKLDIHLFDHHTFDMFHDHREIPCFWYGQNKLDTLSRRKEVQCINIGFKVSNAEL